MVNTFPFYMQADAMDCGPTCLRMIAKYYGKNYPAHFLREKSYIDKMGVSMRGIGEAAEAIGMRSMVVHAPIKETPEQASLQDIPLPAILHWEQNHFVVLYKIDKKHAWIADPKQDKRKISIKELEKAWSNPEGNGLAMILEPTPEFEEHKLEAEEVQGFGLLSFYLKPHRKLFVQLFIGLLVGTFIQLLFPFLTQSLVDIGIETRNLNFIYIVLIGQLVLFLSGTIVRFIQSWIVLHISMRINVRLIADFLLKMMGLPISYFNSKNTGDLLQRIHDHDRIASFLTTSSLGFLLSMLNLLVFGVVLAIYSSKIFLIFLVGSILYLLWILIFMKKRREIDYKEFDQMSDHQDAILEIIHGMPEIKLQGSQQKRRQKWTAIQAKLFRVQMKALSVTQYQDAGALSISQTKDILITFVAATQVLNGSITLGMMLAIQYIIGQLNAPLQQLLGFIRAGQDARISLERLSEVHLSEAEEDPQNPKINIIPEGDIEIKNLDFQYTPIAPEVLKNVNIQIPLGKTTAIVGHSGSGKSTLLNLLLGFYKPTKGQIKVGGQDLNSLQMKTWRRACGVVSQEGFLFSDTILNNIAESDDYPDVQKVINAANMAQLGDFLSNMPQGIHTRIGSQGYGLSQGQKQRILIARAIYKDPAFLFLDEATNALDAKNEKLIVDQLNTFLEGRTAIVVAHRLSTVKQADQIIVLQDGEVQEVGTHEELVAKKAYYYELIKNQLELSK